MATKTISWPLAPILGVGVVALVSAGVAPTPQSVKQDHRGFSLFFNTAGLGSERGTLRPTFRVNGVAYSYTLDQNSKWGWDMEPPLESQLICSGTIRDSSIDSIIALTRSVGDTLIYRTDPQVLSGAISELVVKSRDVYAHFTLHNDSHPVANKIVAILNSNIPTDKQKLWILDPQ